MTPPPQFSLRCDANSQLYAPVLQDVKCLGYCAEMKQPEGWPDRLTRVVAGEVRRWRETRGLSAQRLADKCEVLGLPVRRSTISNLESGRRDSVTLAELLIFARALDVAPAALIAPVGWLDTVEVLPGRFLAPYDAVRWLDGEADLQDIDGKLTAVEADGDLDPLYLFRYHAELIGQWRAAITMHANIQGLIQDLAGTPHEGQVDDLSRMLATSSSNLQNELRELRWTRTRMRRIGLSLPPLPSGLAFIDEEGDR